MLQELDVSNTATLLILNSASTKLKGGTAVNSHWDLAFEGKGNYGKCSPQGRMGLMGGEGSDGSHERWVT